MTPFELPKERGSAKYFHGRDDILGSFEYQLETAYKEEKGGGSIFLVQGPPGAGKTALLSHCRNLATLHGWQTARIDPVALWDTNEMRDHLGRKWYDHLKRVKIGGEIIALPIALSVDFDSSATSPLQMIKGEGKGPLLLFMDEAQRLGAKDVVQGARKGMAMAFLEQIHNGVIGRPVILLVAGLGTTRESLKPLGISRFEEGCFFEMGALDKNSEQDLIMDWIVNEGRVPLRNVSPWVDMITDETYGWPQHIIAYVRPALMQIHKDEGVLTKAGLDAVLIAGQKRKEDYYRERAERLDDNERISFARLITESPPGGKMTGKVILDKLSLEYGEAKASELFQIAREDGVLYRKDGGYKVPIPSMSDWFLSNYLPE